MTMKAQQELKERLARRGEKRGSMASPIEVDRVLRFFHVVGQLKRLKRTGWVDNGRTENGERNRGC